MTRLRIEQLQAGGVEVWTYEGDRYTGTLWGVSVEQLPRGVGGQDEETLLVLGERGVMAILRGKVEVAS